MSILADIAFPFFIAPYATALAVPIAGFLALAVEVVVFMAIYRERRTTVLMLLLLTANAASSLAGFVLLAVTDVLFASRHEPGTFLGLLGWFAGWTVSVILEYGVIRLLTRRNPLSSLGKAVLLANTGSYAVLIFFGLGVPFIDRLLALLPASSIVLHQ
jgi:hypothetical protein